MVSLTPDPSSPDLEVPHACVLDLVVGPSLRLAVPLQRVELARNLRRRKHVEGDQTICFRSPSM
jgi:hypothetical protein